MQQTLTAPFPWQLKQWNYLLNRRRSACLPHALLLSGVQGLGKRLFAVAFTKVLLCKQSSMTGVACNSCHSCQLITANSHPDLHILEPEAEGKLIRIDQIRELIEQMNQTAHQNDYRVAIITPAEAMHIAAANALLKTLEEPGMKTIVCLITAQSGLIPATIRSRCQSLIFNTPQQDAAEQWLQNNLSAGQDSSFLTKLAENAPLRAIALADSMHIEQRQKFLQGLMAMSNKKSHPVELAENWLKFSLSEIVQWISTIVIDLVRIKCNLPRITIINSDYIDFLHQIVSRINQHQLFEYLEKVYAVRKKMSISNPNQQLLLEDLFYSWYQICEAS